MNTQPTLIAAQRNYHYSHKLSSEGRSELSGLGILERDNQNISPVLLRTYLQYE